MQFNKTQRPRMSLVMPALVNINDSTNRTPKDHLAFMQIDCEVLDTELIYLKEKVYFINS